MHNYRQTVVGHFQLHELNAIIPGNLSFIFLDGTGSIGNINLSSAKFLKASTSSGNTNGNIGPRSNTSVFLCQCLSNGIDGAGTIHCNGTSIFLVIAAGNKGQGKGKKD